MMLALVLAWCGCDDPGVGPDGGGGDGDGGGGGGWDGGGNNEFVDAAIPESCKRVDVIIAVDDSSSMEEEKAALRDDVFPAFALALLTVGGGLEDYRIGVLDACPTPANYHTRGEAGECGFASGQVWMTSAAPDLPGEFGCVGDIYSGDTTCSGSNDDEQPASSAAASLEPPNSDGANAGFSREDALLVVVAITDEDEQPTPDQTAQEVYDRLVTAKGGDVRRMVFLGIGGGSACEGAYGSADEAVKLHAITDLFIAQERGVWWDLCQGQLEDGLTEAMAVIEQACDEFPPIP